jgi:hypothetical protein
MSRIATSIISLSDEIYHIPEPCQVVLVEIAFRNAWQLAVVVGMNAPLHGGKVSEWSGKCKHGGYTHDGMAVMSAAAVTFLGV